MLSAAVWGILLVWSLLLLTPLHSADEALFYAIIGAFAVAELVRLGSQLMYYRRGA
jgi:hypothetical protein